MKNRKTILLFLILFAILFSFKACVKDEYDTSKIKKDMYLTPSIAIPIFHSKQTIEDIMENLDPDISIGTDPTLDNLLYLVYTDKLISKRADEVLNLMQQLEEKAIIAGIDIPTGQLAFPPSDTIGAIYISDTLAFKYDENDQMLDSTYLDKMILNFDLSNGFEHYTIVQIRVPDITVSGQQYQHTILLKPSQSNYTEKQTLENVKMIFNNVDYPGLSVLEVYYKFWAVKNPSATDPNNLTSGNQFDINITFDSIDFSAVWGYIGQHELMSQTDSIPVKIFESDYDGIIKFQNPQLFFNINNSLGVPLAVDLSNVKTSSIKVDPSESEKEINFDGSLTTRISLTGATSVDEREEVVFEINEDNSGSSFKTAFNTNPNKISFSVDGNTNPDGNTGTQNFVMDSSAFDVDMELLLPMHCQTSFYGIRDTIPFVLDSLIENVDFLKTLQLQIESDNGLPADVMEQVYFLDSAYNRLDSLFKDPTLRPNIPSAQIESVDLGVKATEPTHQIDMGTITNPGEYFDNVQYLLLEAIVNTAKVNNTAQYAKFYSSNELSIKIGVNAELEYTGTIEDATNLLNSGKR